MALAASSLALLQVVCAMLLLLHARSAAVRYDLEIANDGPITTEAHAVIHSTLHIKNRGISLIGGQKYRFHWIYAPLTLLEKTEHGENSVIYVLSWSLSSAEFIVGNLTVTPVEDRTVTGDQPVPATLTRLSFFLHDPSHYFKLASFIYNWDFGDGTELTTQESSVYHNYSTAGTCVVHLDVTAEWKPDGTSVAHPWSIFQKTGHFAATLELLDAVRSINITGSTDVHVMENVNLSVHIQGRLKIPPHSLLPFSPPLSLCWLIKMECISLQGDGCHRVVTNETSYSLSHVFSDPGQYCLSVRVENGVSTLQSYQAIQVKPSGLHPAFLALPCITLLAAVLGLGVYMTLRGHAQQKDLVEVADFDFSPMSDKASSGPGWSCSQLCCQSCFLWPVQEPCSTPAEHRRLLHPLHKPVKMYTT
ncbi:transmembrane protein 130 [Varanus komodoensis]|uniref:transmembrane protein 130 n=1 Tax=Varanus komodoensis TaxID=61221 RepID=UPI001CF7D026|nr:transmembrane protein 130 [Varanus komodoensis]